MREVYITCFAFLITLNVLISLSRGSSHYNDRDEIYTTKLKQRRKISPLKKRLLGNLPLLKHAVKKWTINREDWSKERRKIAHQTTFVSRDRRFKITQENIKRDHSARTSNPLTSNHGVGFVDRKPRPRSSLHKKEIERFKEVLRKRIKVKPRQEIEFLEDNQDTGAKQDQFESPRYQEVTANDNSDNRDQNGFSNNYVTVIDNIDGKDTDSYSTLSSDEAKNEYTSVENSISEGANEESQLLGKEVDDVLGALTKADSRLNQGTSAGMPQAQGGLALKQPPSSYSDNKGNDVEIIDQNKEDGKNSQNRPPDDVTVIEDNEDDNSNEETRPILSKPVWDAIQQVQRNFTYQQQIAQSNEATQNEEAANETYAPTNLPLPEPLPESRNVTRPSHALSYLENTLKMFDGSNTQTYYHNTTKETEPIHTKDNGQKLFLTGSAEEGPEGTPTEGDHPPIPSPSTHFDNLQHDVSKVKLHWYNQNGMFKPKPASNSLFSFSNQSNETAFKIDNDNSNDLHIKPWHINANANKTDQQDEGDQSPNIGVSFPPPSESENEVNSNSGPPGSVGVKRPTNDFVSSKVHSSEQNVNYRPEAVKADQFYMNSMSTNESNLPAQRGPQSTTGAQDDVTIIEEEPASSEPFGKVRDGNETVLFQDRYTSQRKPPAESEKTYGSPSNEHLVQENSASQFSRFRQGNSTFPWDLGTNKTVLFQDRFTSQRKPHAESKYAYGSPPNKQSVQENSAGQFSGSRQGSSTFPWELGTKDGSLYQIDKPATQRIDKPSKQRYNSENITPYNGRQPEHGQNPFITSQDNEQNQQQMKIVRVVSKLGVPLQVNIGNHSLDSWSKEYQSLKEKLTDLHGQTQGISSPAQSTSYRNNPAFKDTQQMMKQVSRFPSLFVGRESDQKGIGRDKGMFFKDLKGDGKAGNWGNVGGHMNADYLPYKPNEDTASSVSVLPGASSRKIFAVRLENSKDVVGNVRSIQVENQTLSIAPNSSNLQNKMPYKEGANGSDTEKLVNGPLEENNGSVNFVNQRLASRLRSTGSMQLRDTSDSSPSNHDGQSSHQVLMSYFGNETDLRKRLHSNVDNQTESQNDNNALKGQTIQLDNKTTTTSMESVGIKTKQFSSIPLARGDANHTEFVLPKQGINGSKEESLTKYLEDFITLVSSGVTAPSNELNRTTPTPSESESFSSAPKPPPETVLASEASKKENVTDLKNRVIIVVSPKSLRDLMKNRSRNSSRPAVHKGIPVMVEKAKNSSSNLTVSSANKTVVNVQSQYKNVTTNATIHNQVQLRPSLKIANESSNKENVTSKSENDDLNMLYRDELKSLEISLSRDFMSSWIYYQRSFDQMGITPSMLRSGIANLGSAQRLKRVFKKALAGTDLNVLVVGGSISAGGGLEKDRGNVEGVYHKAFSDWWNNTVTPITASQLKISAVAIGGTDSEYFSYCIKNYMRSLPDIVIWELAANDYKRYTGREFAPAKPLEQLIRIILSLPSNPALILVNFFAGNYYKTAVGQDCPDSEDEGGLSIAQHYKLTSLRWRNVICSQENGKKLDLKKLFSSDGYHPSLLGHAQMSALLISYVKGVFEQTISQEMILLRNRTLQSEQHDVLPALAQPIFDDPATPKPLCWTLLTPDYDQKLRNTLPDLEFTEATGFQFANISHWPIRRDRLRCLKAIQTGAMLKMKFIVPTPENKGDYNGTFKRELAVTTHNSFGGMGTLWLDGAQNDARIIQENKGQRRTQVDVLTRKLTPGVHTVTVSALQPGFCLSAVAVL
ncbi:hypothetical protein ACROYT_G018861 [Oculina patagonica]